MKKILKIVILVMLAYNINAQYTHYIRPAHDCLLSDVPIEAPNPDYGCSTVYDTLHNQVYRWEDGAWVKKGLNLYNSDGTFTSDRTVETDNHKFTVNGKLDLNSAGQSVFIGVNAGKNDDGSNNRNNAVGYSSLYSNTTGSYNNAVGYSSLYSNTAGYANNAIGIQSLYNNTAGYANNAIGYSSLYSNTTGYANNAIGYQSLYSNTIGNYNNAVGSSSLQYNTTGNSNNAVGSSSLRYNTTGNYNNAVGSQSLYSNTTGSYNNAVGYGALYRNTAGDRNVAIGYKAGFYETGSNKLYIANSDADADNALIYGEFDNKIFRINGATQNKALSSDPADPPAGYSVQWVSDGTGSGDAGDVMMKINVGGTVKIITLVDFSTY